MEVVASSDYEFNRQNNKMNFKVELGWIGKEFSWEVELNDGIAKPVVKEVTMKFS